MTREQFETLVQEALSDLPQEFLDRLTNVEIAVQEEPTPEDLRSVGLRPDELLLGLYEGTPLTERSVTDGLTLPDRILLFQSDIEQICDTPAQIRDEIRKTVVHEVAHFFGLEEDEIPPWAQ